MGPPPPAISKVSFPFREKLLAAARQQGSLLLGGRNYSEDAEIVLAAVEQGGGAALMFASLTLRSSRSFILQALSRNGLAMAYAPEEFRSDEEVVLTALEKEGWALMYASESLRAKRSFILKAARTNGEMLRHAPVEFRGDREVVLEAMSQSPSAFLHASVELRQDGSLLLDLLDLDPAAAVVALGCGDAKLREDRSLVLELLSKEPAAFQSAAPSLRSDPAFVEEALKAGGPKVLEHVPHALFQDQNLVLALAKSNSEALRYIPRELRTADAVLESARSDSSFIALAPEPLLADSDFALRALDQTGEAARHLSSALWSSRSFVLQAVQRWPKMLEHACLEQRRDPDLVLAAAEKDYSVLQFAAEELRGEKVFALAAVRRAGPHAFEFLAPSLREDSDVIHAAARRLGNDPKDLEMLRQQSEAGNCPIA